MHFLQRCLCLTETISNCIMLLRQLAEYARIYSPGVKLVDDALESDDCEKPRAEAC